MQYLLLGLKVIFPIIVFMALGYLFRSIKITGEKSFKELNKICFRCFLPMMIFYNIYQSNLKEDFELSVLVYAVICVFVTYIVSILLVGRSAFRKEDRSVVIQGIYRSNFVLFGMEVTETICGPTQMGMASILVAIIIPIFNVLAVVLFEMYGSEKKNKWHVVKNILKNPLIIASILGLIVKASGLVLPNLIEELCGDISALATPVALMCLGGTFAFARVSAYKKELLTVCLGRLVIVPAIFITIAAFLGVSGSNMVALMVMLASPTAVSSFSMASEMGGNGELAGMIVVFTSIFSVITIFIWVALLSFLGLIPVT